MNVWNVNLGDIPMNLTLHATASDASLVLSGLPLQRLAVQVSAGNSEVRFDTLNPERMESLSYKTDASDITFHGLANANLTELCKVRSLNEAFRGKILPGLLYTSIGITSPKLL